LREGGEKERERESGGNSEREKVNGVRGRKRGRAGEREEARE